MKVAVLLGSAHRGGNSDTLAERLLDGMGSVGTHSIRRFRPSEMTVAHCQACELCHEGGVCVMDDDMRDVYVAFSEADVVVIASPMFWGYMTSQLKTLFDRLEAIASPRHFGGKDFVLLITYRHYYGSMVEWLGRVTSAFGSRLHNLTCQTYDAKTARDLPITAFPDVLAEAFELGRRVAAERPSE